MADVESLSEFLTMMSALSAAVQQVVDHCLKMRISYLCGAKADPQEEANRNSIIHLASFGIGTALAASTSLEPLAYLGAPDANGSLNAVVAGLLTAFGSSFFNEALGAVRSFKQAQKSLTTPPGGRP